MPISEVGRFEAQALHLELLEQLRQGFPQAHLINHDLKGCGFLLGPKLIAEIGEEHRRGLGDEKQAPVGIIGGEAAEIAATRRAGDQRPSTSRWASRFLRAVRREVSKEVDMPEFWEKPGRKAREKVRLTRGFL